MAGCWFSGGTLTALCSGRSETVWTSMQDVGNRTHLTCQLNQSSVAITGHRWMRGKEVLLEDNQQGLKTDYK